MLAKARKTGVKLLAYGLSSHYIEIFQITRLSDFMKFSQMKRVLYLPYNTRQMSENDEEFENGPRNMNLITRRLDEVNTVFDISGEVTSAAENQMTEAYNQATSAEKAHYS